MTRQFPSKTEEELQLWEAAVGEDAITAALTRAIHAGYWAAVCEKRILLPKPAARPVGRPRMSGVEQEGRRAYKATDNIWRFWQNKLGERFEVLAGPLYRQWLQKVAQEDWDWLVKFYAAQPWQQLQGPMAGREWAE